jgi:Rab GDP dissociation inhibitor
MRPTRRHTTVCSKEEEENTQADMDNIGMNLSQTTMKQVYDKYGLEQSTRDFIGHSMALYATDDYIESKGMAKDCVERIRLYVNSMARYGKSPYIYPLYGLGELPQGFARLSAIYGGTYMLNTNVDEVKYENGKVSGIRATMKERGEEGDGMKFETKCSKILADPSYFPDKAKVVGHLIKAICILNHPIDKTDNSDSVQLIIPQSQVGRKHDIYIAMVSGAHNVCPKGYYSPSSAPSLRPTRTTTSRSSLVSTVSARSRRSSWALPSRSTSLSTAARATTSSFPRATTHPATLRLPLVRTFSVKIGYCLLTIPTDDVKDIYARAEGHELKVEGLKDGQNLVAEE